MMEQLVRELESLRRRVDYLEAANNRPNVPTGAAALANPPTDAELDSLFGTASTLYDGFIALAFDSGVGGEQWFVAIDNAGSWYTVEITLAT